MIDDQTTDALYLCDQLNQHLDRYDAERAGSILMQLEGMKGFDYGIFYQFICSKKARLWEQLGMPSSQIIPLIEAGLSVTLEKFDESLVDNIVLIKEEPELLHTRARLYVKDGDIDAALRLLAGMKNNLANLPIADREKECQFTPVLLSLSDCLMQTGDYVGVLEACNLGAKYSAARKQGRHNPDFELYRALALKGLGRTGECHPYLKHAYFGYMQLGEPEKAKKLHIKAIDDFGIQINNYGVDELELLQHPAVPYSRGEPIDCYSLGTMINALRDRESLSLSQLCRGICDKSTLLRIEKDELPGNFYTLEALMQRLGRDINVFQDFFLNTNDFWSMQHRDQIDWLLIARKYREAELLLKELESMGHFVKHRVNQQFIGMAKALMFASRSDSLPPELPVMLMEALKITYPKFTELYIDRYPLTYNEIFIINQYAGYYKDTGDASRAANIYKSLLHNLNERYVDEVAKARMFAAITLNYSSCLGLMGKRHKALAVISEAMEVERTHRRLTMLPGLSFNKGYNLLKLGKTKESIPYFAMSYYVADMFAPYDNVKAKGAEITKNLVKEEMGLVFD